MEQKTIEFYLECLDKYMYVQSPIAMSTFAQEIMTEAYKQWIYNYGNLIKGISCDEHICNALDEKGIKYTVRYGKAIRVYDRKELKTYVLIVDFEFYSKFAVQESTDCEYSKEDMEYLYEKAIAADAVLNKRVICHNK